MAASPVGVQVAALAASAALAVPARASPEPLLAAAVVVGVRLLQRRPHRPRALAAIDGAVTAVLLLAAGAPHSPLLPVALAGVDRRAGGVFAYCAAFAACYLGVMAVFDEPLLGEALKSAALVVLAAAVPLPEGRAAETAPASPWPALAPLDPSARSRLARALPERRAVPPDGLIAGAAQGLAAEQTELLAYLALGLSNRGIAETLCVSEATVKYRLTRLYRRLGVRDRHSAVEAARRLGLATALRAVPLSGAPSADRARPD